LGCVFLFWWVVGVPIRTHKMILSTALALSSNVFYTCKPPQELNPSVPLEF
jgi:hypothetical protein